MQATEKNPLLSELKTLKHKMDELYSESFGSEGCGESPKAGRSGGWKPTMDVLESPQEWRVILDIPGISKEELHVEVKENRLNVWGKRCCSHAFDGYEEVRVERPRGRFARSIELEGDIDTDDIHAELKEGVLTIRVPRRSSPGFAAQRIKVHRE